MSLKNEFSGIVAKYVYEFCKKHEAYLDFWVADDHGTIGQFGAHFFNFDDIRFDIDNNIQKNKIYEWYDYTLEHNYISFRNYLKKEEKN